MRLKPIILYVLFLVPLWGFSQEPQSLDAIRGYFTEIREATSRNRQVWARDIYGPLLLVDPESRMSYANVADTSGILKPQDDIFLGLLPETVNIANTALDWGGRRWSMIMLPLPDSRKKRINLLAHELFHAAQPALGFYAHNPENNHLDSKEGRIYFRLELEALKTAITTDNKQETLQHLQNALKFRAHRQSLFPGSDSTENLLELNEGICEYTGILHSGRSHTELQQHFAGRIERFHRAKSFVRSFAYETVPIYGYLWHLSDRFWHRGIGGRTNLGNLFAKTFSTSALAGVKSLTIKELGRRYNGLLIEEEESLRDEKLKAQLAEYRRKFVNDPHLFIPFEKMNMSFDYRIIVPLDDHGTVYPIIRVTDNWGILTVENGALIDSNWSGIVVAEPEEMAGVEARGDGWVLALKPGYSLVRESRQGNFRLVKNDN